MSEQPTVGEIAYTKEYLKGRSAQELFQFVQRQPEKWTHSYPCESIITTSAQAMRNQLLKPGNGFTRRATPPNESPDTENPENTLELGSQPDEQVSQHELHLTQVKVIIERDNAPKISVFLDVPLVEHDASSMHLSVSVHELIAALQRSASAVQGCVKLLCPDPEEPDCWTVFACFSSLTPSDAKITDEMDVIAVPSDKKLRLRLELDMSSSNKRKHEDLSSGSELDGEQSEGLDVHHPDFKPRVEALRRGRVWAADQSEDRKWLETELSSLPGYSDFVHNRGRQDLSNDTIRQHWSFIASTSEKYTDTKMKLPKTKKYITKKMLAATLGIVPATLYAAKAATTALRVHETDARLVERLKKDDGSTTLAEFLAKLDKESGKAQRTRKGKNPKMSKVEINTTE